MTVWVVYETWPQDEGKGDNILGVCGGERSARLFIKSLFLKRDATLAQIKETSSTVDSALIDIRSGVVDEVQILNAWYCKPDVEYVYRINAEEWSVLPK